MRLLTALLALGLLASAYLAPRHHGAREAAFPLGRFLDPDARKRAKEAEQRGQLGVAMAAYEELVRDHPGDPEILRDRMRVVFLAGSVALGQPNVGDLVYQQATTYLEQRDRLDPQGDFLDGVVATWIDGRLNYDMTLSVYPRAAMAIFLAARGDPAGRERLLDLAGRGAFHMQFFPFARRYHPGWPAAETLIAHYLEKGDLLARIEAGVTLLDYNGLFGVGEELLARHLPTIRSAIREMREKMRDGPAVDASDVTRATIIGMALLASRGDEESLRALAAAKSERELLFYVPSADAVRVARVWTGLDPFDSLNPLSARYKDLDSMDQELYYVAAAHRATRLAKEGGAGGAEFAALLDLLESGFDGTVPAPKILAMQTLLRIAPERGSALVARALDGRGALAVYAGVLAGAEDRVALFLPALSSVEPDVSALGAVSLRDPSAPPALAR